MNQKKSKAWLAIVIIIALGALAYLVYYMRVSVQEPSQPIVNQLESQGTSDEVSVIEQDLSGTALEGLDSEVSDIEKELQSAGL
ncbi:MAG: hypothetical protein AAB556_02740 [Patescibacteria group bacterium]